MSQVAAVLVTYQSSEVIAGAIESCLAAGCDVVVVDNASSDGTAEIAKQWPQVKLIANAENRGFAAAVNQGFRATSAPFVLLLNPDAVLVNGLEDLVEALHDPGTGASTGRLCDQGGRMQRGFGIRRFPTPLALVFEVLGINRLWPSNSVNRRYRCLDMNEDIATDVEQPAGAFLLIRRDEWERIGGFDERFYPVWFEDVDFCERLHMSGRRIRYVPGSTARHRGAHSASQLSWSNKELYWYGSLLEYARKHFSRSGLYSVSFAVVWGALPRMGMGIFRAGLRPVSVYSKVIVLACRYIVSGK